MPYRLKVLSPEFYRKSSKSPSDLISHLPPREKKKYKIGATPLEEDIFRKLRMYERLSGTWLKTRAGMIVNESLFPKRIYFQVPQKDYLDFYHYLHWGLYIISGKFLDIMKKREPSAIQAFPVEIYDYDEEYVGEYYYVNLLNVRFTLDVERSERLGGLKIYKSESETSIRMPNYCVHCYKKFYDEHYKRHQKPELAICDERYKGYHVWREGVRDYEVYTTFHHIDITALMVSDVLFEEIMDRKLKGIGVTQRAVFSSSLKD